MLTAVIGREHNTGRSTARSRFRFKGSPGLEVSRRTVAWSFWEVKGIIPPSASIQVSAGQISEATQTPCSPAVNFTLAESSLCSDGANTSEALVALCVGRGSIKKYLAALPVAYC
jgi:hypothetical protein